MNNNDDMSEDVTELKQRLEDMNENVMMLVSAMIGNKLTKDGGLVKKVNDIDAKINNIDTRVQTLERDKERRMIQFATILAIGTAIGIVLQIAIQIFSAFIKK